VIAWNKKRDLLNLGVKGLSCYIIPKCCDRHHVLMHLLALACGKGINM
jgi:hypothetical protein